jgi:diacylglycerol kinase family enzyme
VRGLLVVNPNATTTNERVRDVLVHALASVVALEVVVTTHRGHARELGEKALRDGLDVVVTLGGDGTINEVVNGMLIDGPGPDVPALATVPGGSANVLARASGLPRDPVEATGVLIAGLEDHRFRTINLATANDRWLTMNVGMGLDAEIIIAMERKRGHGKRATPARYLGTTLREYFAGTDRRHPSITIEQHGQDDIDHVFLAIVQNAAPWTFMGDLPVNPCPDASFDRNLDVFAIRDLRILPSLRWTRRLLMGSSAGSAKGLFVGRDLGELTLVADRPTAAQLDGESLGQIDRLVLRSVSRALRIVV